MKIFWSAGVSPSSQPICSFIGVLDGKLQGDWLQKSVVRSAQASLRFDRKPVSLHLSEQLLNLEMLWSSTKVDAIVVKFDSLQSLTQCWWWIATVDCKKFLAQIYPVLLDYLWSEILITGDRQSFECEEQVERKWKKNSVVNVAYKFYKTRVDWRNGLFESGKFRWNTSV